MVVNPAAARKRGRKESRTFRDKDDHVLLEASRADGHGVRTVNGDTCGKDFGLDDLQAGFSHSSY